ncbi:MAG: 30S ribosome-binding factor RbfA [Proteobacteria bacterium]|jgi:ribosome-binding factor A|nr:30S ribosome-binding factor RbfA [Pseudomonadota bacterium]MCG6936395.1 30S ribosome-binding factor RbfA [Pseudomonadota bacterium]
MPKDFSRTRRVAEQMQRELALLLQREIRDPRLASVTISGVEVSRDLAVAKVYFTLLDDQADPAEAQRALDKASGFLRHALGESMILRSLPQLRFIYDVTLIKGTELTNLIDQVVDKDRKRHKDPD